MDGMDTNDEEMFFPAKLIRKLTQDEAFSDVEFVAVDDQVILSNKMVLAMVCSYFAEMFYGNNSRLNVRLVNYSSERKVFLKIVLEFIYKGALNLDELTDEQKIGVYALAKEFKFADLASIVESELHNIGFSLENVAKVFEVASRHQLQWLVDKCLSFIDENSEELVNSKDVFSTLPANLVLDLVKRQTFYATEMDIFEAVRHWASTNSKEDATEILKHLRFKLISNVDFAKSIHGTGLVSPDTYFESIKTAELIDRIKVTTKGEKNENRSTDRSSISSSTGRNNLAVAALSDLLFDNRLSDVSFVFPDNEVIPAHRVVLTAACPFFAELFAEETQEVTVQREIIHARGKLFQMVLDYIYGKKVSFATLTDEELIDLFELTQNVSFTPMTEEVAQYVDNITVTMDNVATHYMVAVKNGLKGLMSNCVVFAENNADELIATTEVFATLSQELVERIVRQNMNRNVFEALKVWKMQNEMGDISDLLSALPLQSIPVREFAADIRPTGLVSDDQYFEAHLSEDQTAASVVNVSCDYHGSSICKPRVLRIFSKHSKGIVCEEIKTFEKEKKAHLFNQHGESIVVELENACVINTIRFQLFDEKLRLFSYEVKVGVRKDFLETVKPHFAGRYYASKQEIVFQPKPVKFLQITSFESHPLEVYLWTIEALFNNGIGSEMYTGNPGCDMIAHLQVDDKAKSMYDVFNCGIDEVVFVLRYPYKVSTVGIQLSGHFGSKVTLLSKNHMQEQWQKQAEVNGLDSNTVIVFKETMVSFIKIEGAQIRNKVRHVECPAASATFHV